MLTCISHFYVQLLAFSLLEHDISYIHSVGAKTSECNTLIKNTFSLATLKSHLQALWYAIGLHLFKYTYFV